MKAAPCQKRGGSNREHAVGSELHTYPKLKIHFLYSMILFKLEVHVCTIDVHGRLLPNGACCREMQLAKKIFVEAVDVNRIWDDA
jgi:hypothetical protein